MANRKLRRTRAPANEKKINNQLKTNDKVQSVKQKALVLAQEIKITRLLANNDKKVRDKVLKRLEKWLVARSQSSYEFTKKDFFILWKGLFYSMWMSDKMLIQEELAESLSKLVHCFHENHTIVLYTSCALKLLAKEWFGIDQYRLDKFSMLVRRILRQTFVACKIRSYDMEFVTEIAQVFEELFLNSQTGLGFSLHVTEIYLEELAKVSDGNIPKAAVHQFIKPFATCLATTKDERQVKHIIRYVFRYLIFQSDVGLDYKEKFEAWRDAGFPCTHVDKMEKVEISDVEEEDFDNENEEHFENAMQNEVAEKPLDPRAGRVNVELPQIPFDAANIIELLKQYRFHSQSSSKSRRQISRLLTEFEELSEGRMPIGIKRVRKPQIQKEMNTKQAALRLLEFEKNLKIDEDETSVDRPKCEDNSDLNSDVNVNTADSENDIVSTKKAKLRNTEVATVLSKKRKKEFTIDKSNDALESAKKKQKKSCSTDEKVELKNAHADMARDNLRTKKRTKAKKSRFLNAQLSETAHIPSSPNLEKKKRLKKADQSTSTTLSKSNVSQNATLNNATQVSLKKKLPNRVKKQPILNLIQVSLKKKLPNLVKKQTILNNEIEKKKVVFGLSRNSAQHKSEYLQQVRKSPAIPFDANKKPLAGVLKASPIPSPLNPFYKAKRAVKKQK